jgi:hypothetical protein
MRDAAGVLRCAPSRARRSTDWSVERRHPRSAPAGARRHVLVLDEFALAPDARINALSPPRNTCAHAELAGGVRCRWTMGQGGRRETCPVPTRIVGACPAARRGAAHPRLQVTTGLPALAVTSGDVGALPPGVLRTPAGDKALPVQGPLAWIDGSAREPALIRMLACGRRAAGAHVATDRAAAHRAHSAGIDAASRSVFPPSIRDPSRRRCLRASSTRRPGANCSATTREPGAGRGCAVAAARSARHRRSPRLRRHALAALLAASRPRRTPGTTRVSRAPRRVLARCRVVVRESLAQGADRSRPAARCPADARARGRVRGAR